MKKSLILSIIYYILIDLQKTGKPIFTKLAAFTTFLQRLFLGFLSQLVSNYLENFKRAIVKHFFGILIYTFKTAIFNTILICHIFQSDLSVFFTSTV